MCGDWYDEFDDFDEEQERLDAITALKAKGIAYMPRRDCVIRPAYMRRLATALANVSLPRRRVPDWMATVIYDFKGAIICGETLQVAHVDFEIDIDDAFNDEGSFRWLSDFMKFESQEPRQAGRGALRRGCS